jgi:hypothetical protein
MIKIRKERGLNIEGWETPEAVMRWWLDDDSYLLDE